MKRGVHGAERMPKNAIDKVANHFQDNHLGPEISSSSRFLATALSLLASKLLTRLLAIDEKR